MNSYHTLYKLICRYDFRHVLVIPRFLSEKYALRCLTPPAGLSYGCVRRLKWEVGQ